MRQLLYGTIIIFLLTSCINTRKQFFGSIPANLTGTWRSEDDSLAVLDITSQTILEFYDGHLIDSSNYLLSVSCTADTANVRSVVAFDLANPFFIQRWNSRKELFCYELVSIGPHVLSWRFVATGKLFVFQRTRQKKR